MTNTTNQDDHTTLKDVIESWLWKYKYPPEFDLGKTPKVSFFKTFFCDHEITNYVYCTRYPDICFDYCSKCKQWYCSLEYETSKLPTRPVVFEITKSLEETK